MEGRDWLLRLLQDCSPQLRELVEDVILHTLLSAGFGLADVVSRYRFVQPAVMRLCVSSSVFVGPLRRGRPSRERSRRLREAVRRGLEAGFNHSQVARLVGVSRTTVIAIARELRGELGDSGR